MTYGRKLFQNCVEDWHVYKTASHLKRQEALFYMAFDLLSLQHWEGNKKADELATKGLMVVEEKN